MAEAAYPDEVRTRNLMRLRGLERAREVDGEVGPNTWAALRSST
ncbi:hypothetical protein [Streptomyces sp. NBC_01304]|nr:hypothetical protein OG430_20315 [Streptomyces sp. NBC_01304]